MQGPNKARVPDVGWGRESSCFLYMISSCTWISPLLKTVSMFCGNIYNAIIRGLFPWGLCRPTLYASSIIVPLLCCKKMCRGRGPRDDGEPEAPESWGGALQHKRNADNSKDTFYFSIPGAYLTQLPFLCHMFYELNCVPSNSPVEVITAVPQSVTLCGDSL